MDIKKALFIKKNQYIEINYSAEKDINYLDLAASYLEDGAGIIQLNQNKTDDKSFLKLAKDLRQLTSLYSALFIIKDRADIVQIAEADGIFLDKKSISLADCKKVLGNLIVFGTNILSANENFDFCLSDKKVENTAFPTFYKVKSDEYATLYRLGKYDFNK